MTESVESFQTIYPEGPFAFKETRDQPITQHFDRFKELNPDQTSDLLAVRDGSRASCLFELPGEVILAEHAGVGYVDESTHRAWGYTLRRRSTGQPRKANPVVSSHVSSHAPTPNVAPAPARNATGAEFESEFQKIRIELLTHKVRSEQFDNELAAVRNQHKRTVDALAEAESTAAAVRLECERIKLEKKRLEDEGRHLRAELAECRASRPVTPSIAPTAPVTAASSAMSAKIDQDKRQFAEEKARLDRDRAVHAKDNAKLLEEQKALKNQKAELESRIGELESHVEAQEVWVAPDAHTSRSAGNSGDEATLILIRIGICWFVTLVLLFQCLRLARQAFGWG